MNFFMHATLALFLTSASYGQTFQIQLTENDQSELTKELSKIDFKYRSEELVDKDLPTWHVVKKYNFLNSNSAFYINCSEEFWNASVVGINRKCDVGFNYETSSNEISVHDGFMSAFAIAEIKDFTLSKDLYKTIGNGVSPVVFFSSSEQIVLTHPATGEKFSAFRLRIECKRDTSYKAYSCQVSAVK